MNNTLIDNWEDLDVVLPIYDILRIIQWHQEVCEVIIDTKLMMLLLKIIINGNCDGKSFDYNTNIVGKTPERSSQPGNQGNADRPGQPSVSSLNAEVAILLKYLSNFWRSVDLTMMKCVLVVTLSINDKIKVLENNIIRLFVQSLKTGENDLEQGRIQKFWKGRGAQSRPPWLAGEEHFRFQMV